jgi:hypothetical protein
MEKYKDMTVMKRSNVKMIRNLIFFVALIIFTFWFLLKDQDLNELVDAIKSADIKFVFGGAFLMLLVYIMESINVRSILISLGEKKFGILRALKYTFIGNFFSAVTPAATGGQPVEIYYMTKDGIKGANGTMAMLMQLCGFQISTLVLSIIGGILNPSLLSDGIIWFYLLGLTINGVALAFMLIGTFSTRLSKKIVNHSIKTMKKIKLKNADKIEIKLNEGIEQYSKSAVYIRSHKNEFIKSVLRVFVQITIYHSIPYFVYRSFGLNELNFFQIFSMQSVLYTTVSGIPLPGSIGVSESLFLKLYGKAFGTTLLSGAMLLYRFVSFYFYLVVGALVFIITAVRTKDVVSEIDENIKFIDGDIKKKSKSNKLAYS